MSKNKSKIVKQLTRRRAIEIYNSGSWALLSPDQLIVMVHHHKRLFCPIDVTKTAWDKETTLVLM